VGFGGGAQRSFGRPPLKVLKSGNTILLTILSFSKYQFIVTCMISMMVKYILNNIGPQKY